MLVKTEGIILKITKFKETSLIVKAYTQSHGLLSFIVNGVRTAKQKNKAVLFRPLNFLDLIIYYRENKSLLHLKEYKFNTLYESIPFDIVKSSLATFMLEVLSLIVREEEENQALYAFLKHSFLQLDHQQEQLANYHLYFIAALTQHIGISAQGKHSATTPYFNMTDGQFAPQINNHHYLQGKESEQFSALMQQKNIAISKTERKALLHHFIRYFQIHIEGFHGLKSIDILETVLS